MTVHPNTSPTETECEHSCSEAWLCYWMYIAMMLSPLQMGGADCRLFSLANATALCHGVDPMSCIYDQRQMRKHFWHCLTNRRMEVFPLHRKRRIMPQPVKVENFPLYCHCRLPWDRNHAHDDMMMCSICRDWFHETCDNAQSNSQSQWVCKRCQKQSN